MSITDFRRSSPAVLIGTAFNSYALGGVTVSSNGIATAGWVLVATGSNSAIWRDAISFGSNTNDVGSVGTMGASSSNSRADHVHRGVASISHTSNTFYGGLTLTTPDNSVGITMPSAGILALRATGSGGSAALTYVQGQLAADVSMASANTYYDGPSVTLTQGTWLLYGVVTYDGNNNATLVTAKLWDGTTVAASCETICYGAAVGRKHAAPALTGVAVVTSGTPTWKISLAGNGATTTMLKAAPDNGAGNNASTLIAVRIA